MHCPSVVVAHRAFESVAALEKSHQRYALTLAILFAGVFIALAIAPLHRADWALENVLVVLAVVLLIVTYRKFPFSRVSYTLIFLFLCLHEVGSHYTYSEVPYNAWTEAMFGRSLNDMLGWERNHFDRLIHFTYGFFIAYPLREVFLRIVNVRGFWGYFLPLDITMSTSMIYELIEWGAAEVFGGDLGAAYLGTQGDVWDAHKDMLLASIGGLIAMLITAAVNKSLQRDFSREWSESLRIKRKEPLGETEIERLRNGG